MDSSPARSAQLTRYPPHLASPRSIADDVRATELDSPTTRITRHRAPSLSRSSSHVVEIDSKANVHERTASSASSAAWFGSRSELEFSPTRARHVDSDDHVVLVDSPYSLKGKRRSEDYGMRASMGEEFADDRPILNYGTPPRQRQLSKTARRKLRLFYIALGATAIVVACVSARSASSRSDWSETIDRWKVQAKTWSSVSDPGPTSGYNGSIVSTDQGVQFVYENKFDGHWNSTPFSLDAQAQSYTPPLSEQWDYSTQRILGVNLGGWLNLEPFISPSLFEPYLNTSKPAVDEWSLCENLGRNMPRVLKRHYDTFITEKDFADIASAGLNWVRIPLPHWAIETTASEPFLPRVSWEYFLKAITWARKYGIRINLDLHTVPGSQNGWNHSGKYGSVNFLHGVMGVANAQRTLNIIRALAEFISRPENAPVVPMLTVLNEPFMRTTGVHALRTFYLEAYKTIRAVSGIGAGHGPMVVVHDGFKGTRMWHGWLEGSDRLALESHRYLAFRDANTDPLELQAIKPCQNWASDFNRTMSKVGLALTGEWSIATDDCGMFLNGVGVGTRLEGTFPTAELADKPGVAPVGACDHWSDPTTWSDERKADLRAVAMAHMDAFQNWFYWTWKTLPPLNSDLPANPRWSYSLGWRNGWLPADPRSAQGFCTRNADRLGIPPPKQLKFNRPLLNWQVGQKAVRPDERELGQINATQLEAWGKFPPESIGTSVERLDTVNLPQLVKSRVPGQGEIVLEGPRPPGVASRGGDGNRSGWWVPVDGCRYLDPWQGVGADVPGMPCVGGVSDANR